MSALDFIARERSQSGVDYAVVVPTIGRPELSTLLQAVAAGAGPLPREVVVVNDRPLWPLELPSVPLLAGRLRVVAGAGRGPAAARNRGYRATNAAWVVFLDDDVRPDPGWRGMLADDLATAAHAGAVAARIHVPLSADSRPTDWQRQVLSLAEAPWITADIAYRRAALDAVGGFYEGFASAYREDTDLATRVRGMGFDEVRGRRRSAHPVAPARWWISVARQRGNADDALLRRRYGRRWHRVTGVPRGRRAMHLLTTAAGLIALGAALARRRRATTLAAALWLALTAQFAVHRVLAGPRTKAEVATMGVTSVAIPPAATLHWLRGRWRHRHAARISLLPPAQTGRTAW